MARYILFPLLFLSIIVHGQNLVPNYGFEQYQYIPCAWNTIPSDFSQYVNSWFVPSATSTDIHSTLAQESCWSNPTSGKNTECLMGVQSPHTGNVMAGIYTYVSSHCWHEYLAVKLSEPLTPGLRYCVEFWVSAADYGSHATNNIGVIFSDEPIYGGDIIVGKPQINYTEVITDIDGWVPISGSFVAETASQYITIGNFFSDLETSIIPLREGSCTNGAYYYIDDIAVYICPI